MPRVHPRRRVVDAHVVDPTDWRDAWMPYSQLLGGVDEHNINADRVSTIATIEGDFDAEVFGVFGSAGNVTDEGLAAMYNTGSYSRYAAVPGNLVIGSRQWAAIPHTSADFTSDGGKLRVQLRAALRQGALGAGRPACCKMGVMVDGGLVAESVIGGQDVGWEASNMEQGVSMDRHTQNCEVTIPISPGRHTLEGVFWLEGMEGVPISSDAPDAFQRILYATLDYRVMTR